MESTAVLCNKIHDFCSKIINIHTGWDKDVNCPTLVQVSLLPNQYTTNLMKKTSGFNTLNFRIENK